MGLATNQVRKLQGMIERARAREYPRMGDNTEEPAQDQIGYGERFVCVEHSLEP